MSSIYRDIKQRSMRIMLFGTFDGLHPGHVHYLQEGQRKGEMIVIVARDENVRRIKGFLPEHNEQQRKAAIEKQFPLARVFLGNVDDFLAPVRDHTPDIIFLGYDQRLPPGITVTDLSCAIERATSFEPEKYKSSILRKKLEARE